MKMHLLFALAAVILTSAKVTVCDPKKETTDEYSKMHRLAGTAKGAAALSQAALGLIVSCVAVLGVAGVATGTKKAFSWGFIAVGVLTAPSCFYASWKFAKSSRSSFRKAHNNAKAA